MTKNCDRCKTEPSHQGPHVAVALTNSKLTAAFWGDLTGFHDLVDDVGQDVVAIKLDSAEAWARAREGYAEIDALAAPIRGWPFDAWEPFLAVRAAAIRSMFAAGHSPSDVIEALNLADVEHVLAIAQAFK